MVLVKDLVVMVAVAVLATPTNAQKLSEQKRNYHNILSCQTDEDCKENSSCFGNDIDGLGKCKCESGFELFRNSTFYKCFKAKFVGEACDINTDCQVHSHQMARCNQNNTCECGPEAHSLNGTCYLKIRLGGICMSDENCYIDDGTPTGALASCEKGLCSCGPNQNPSQDQTRCLTNRNLGELCTFDEECLVTTPNTRCADKCECAPDHTLSRNQNMCVKGTENFGEPCDFDGQCVVYLQDSTCIDGKCGCTDGYHQYGRQCARTRKAEENCKTDAECIYDEKLTDNVKCDGGKCTCLNGIQNGACTIRKYNKPGSASTFNSFVGFKVLIILIFIKLLLIE